LGHLEIKIGLKYLLYMGSTLLLCLRFLHLGFFTDKDQSLSKTHLTRPKYWCPLCGCQIVLFCPMLCEVRVEGVEMEEDLFVYWTGLVKPVPPRNVATQVRRAFLLLTGTGLPAPEWTTCHQCSMKDNAKWSGNSFLLGSSSLANHGQLITFTIC
jgi:hypothetical protein